MFIKGLDPDHPASKYYHIWFSTGGPDSYESLCGRRIAVMPPPYWEGGYPGCPHCQAAYQRIVAAIRALAGTSE